MEQRGTLNCPSQSTDTHFTVSNPRVHAFGSDKISTFKRNVNRKLQGLKVSAPKKMEAKKKKQVKQTQSESRRLRVAGPAAPVGFVDPTSEE